jgi:Castor and Pollux, part of voltage-gated ion channel
VSPLRRRLRSLSRLLVYRADQYLGWPPLVQIAIVLLATAALVAALGFVATLASPSDPELAGKEGLWWAATRFMDGGTMASDPNGRRALAIVTTIAGILSLSFLTGALTSKMSERIADLRSGKNPVVERGHILILGFDAKVTFIARELARSAQTVAVVAMAQEDKERVEMALRPARRICHNRIRFAVRTGDPRSELALLRVGADTARSIIVVPPTALDDAASVNWTLSTLLAIRRTVGPRFAGQVVVEARHARARPLLDLASEADVAGPGTLATRVISSDVVIAKLLAQSARQEGVYFALRELMSFVGSEVYLDAAPAGLIGKTFDEAHASLGGGILIGIHRQAGRWDLGAVAPRDPIQAGDRIAVVAKASRKYQLGESLPALTEAPRARAGHSHGSEHVVVVGFNKTLRPVLLELDEILTDDSRVTVMACPLKTSVAALLAEVRPLLMHVRLEHDARDPSDLFRAGAGQLEATDAMIILGCEDENDENGDASALATLLWVRHWARTAERGVRRVVTEVRDLRSATHVRGTAFDILVSSDVVAMLLAQCALEPSLGDLFDEILSSVGHEVFLRPRAVYVGDGDATFGEVMAAARARSEIALGLYPAPSAFVEPALREVLESGELADWERSPVWLNPPRSAPVPSGADAHVVVLGLSERGLSRDSIV